MTCLARGGQSFRVEKENQLRRKIVEWFWRYLPNEIAGTAAELGGAGVVYLCTGSLALAAVVGAVFSSVGYYGAAYVNAVRWAMPDQQDRARVARVLAANLLALRSVAVEFGPAEAIDTLAVRPAAFFFFPALVGNVAAGLVLGKVVADIAFYALAICSYEKFKRLLVTRRVDRREGDGAIADTVQVA